MGYYNTKKGIEEYIKRSKDRDYTKLIKILKKYLCCSKEELTKVN